MDTINWSLSMPQLTNLFSVIDNKTLNFPTTVLMTMVVTMMRCNNLTQKNFNFKVDWFFYKNLIYFV